MSEREQVTITLPATIAEILRDVCNEWVNDHARFSKATQKMTGMFLSVILEQIDNQIKAQQPEPQIEGFVCPTCYQSFKSARALKCHRTRMKHL